MRSFSFLGLRLETGTDVEHISAILDSFFPTVVLGQVGLHKGDTFCIRGRLQLGAFEDGLGTV